MIRLMGIILLSFFVSLGAFAQKQPSLRPAEEVGLLEFTVTPTDEIDSNFLKINGEQTIPPFTFNQPSYHAISLNTLKPIQITVADQTKHIQLKELNPKQYITIRIKSDNPNRKLTKEYKVYTAFDKMPSVRMENTGAQPGYIFIAPYTNLLRNQTAYAYIVDENGSLKFYRANKVPGLNIMDFKQTKLKDKVRYSLFEQSNPFTPGYFDYGHRLIFDENFVLIDTVHMAPSDRVKEMPIENHDFIILDDGHYIMSTYVYGEEHIAGEAEKSKVLSALIQEVKDGRVIFEWSSLNDDLIRQSCFERCIDKTSHDYRDYAHLNSITIDPSDGNLILSLAAEYQVIKIDRQTGKTLWRLGGKTDEFGLKPDQFFIRQHFARITPDGYLMLFDNQASALHPKEFSKHKPFDLKPTYQARILKFKLDEKNKKITDFVEIPLGVRADIMSSVHYVKPDRYYVGYGAPQIAGEEIGQDRHSYLKIYLQSPYVSYRSYKIAPSDL